jgi:hypothetical protein
MPLHAYSVCVVLTPKHKDAWRIKFAVEVLMKFALSLCQCSGLLGQSRLGGASSRSSHVRNAPLATVGPKKAARREGPFPEVAA